MANEVKLVHHPVGQACAELNAAAQGMQATFKSRIEGESRLDIVEQINQLNSSYNNLMSMYQAMLLEHIEATRKTAETLKATDVNLATAISFIRD